MLLWRGIEGHEDGEIVGGEKRYLVVYIKAIWFLLLRSAVKATFADRFGKNLEGGRESNLEKTFNHIKMFQLNSLLCGRLL